MKTVWTNDDLQEWFDLYNARYFGGRLEVAHLGFKKMYPLGRTVRLRVAKRRSQQDKWAIWINWESRRSRRISLGSLIHEMVHVEQGCKYTCGRHGVYFNRRMKELAALGAFDGIW